MKFSFNSVPDFARSHEQGAQASFAEVRAQYFTALGDVSKKRDQSLNLIAQDRLRWEQLDDANPTNRQVEQRLKGDVAGVHTAISTARSETEAVIQKSDYFIKFVSPADMPVWRQLRTDVSTYGVVSGIVSRTLASASSQQSRDAMKLALDADVWRQLRMDVSTYGIGSSVVERTLASASSQQSRDAMKLALDADVWRQLRMDVSTYGIDSSTVTRTLGRASSRGTYKVFNKALGRTERVRDWRERTFTEEEFIWGAFGTGQGRQWDMGGNRGDTHGSSNQQQTPPRNEQRPSTHPNRPPKPAHEVRVDNRITALKQQGLDVTAIQRKLRFEFHPDRAGGDPAKIAHATEAFKYIDHALGLVDRPSR